MAIAHDGYVQFGCGLTAPTTWVNFDASPTLRLQKIPGFGRLLTRGGPVFPANVVYGDIVKGLPILPESCTAVYCSHVLEHLALADFRTALRNTFTCIKPLGTFRFVVPDLAELAADYLASTENGAAGRFMEATCLGVTNRARGLRGAMREWLGNSKHLWMWDYKSLAAELQAAGFTNIRRAALGDAADARFRDVEDPSRWDRLTVGIECNR